jgi:flavin-dependent dehydrogenase
MRSGQLAAEAVIQAKFVGDFSRKTLSLYDSMLRDNFLMDDLRNSRKLGDAHEVFPWLMDALPTRVGRLFTDLYGQSLINKRAIRKRAVERFLDGLPKLRAARDLWRMKGMMG